MKREFEGFFIPANILEIPDLSFYEKVFISYIKDHCTIESGASLTNKELSDFFGKGERQIQNTLASLSKRGYLQVSHDGERLLFPAYTLFKS